MKMKAMMSSLGVSVALLAGCSFSSGDSNSGGNGGESAEEITVEIVQGKVEINDQFEELAATYEEQNPGINIEITSIGGGSDYIGTLTSRFSAGDDPAIFSVAGPTEAEQFEEYLTDMSDTESADLALEGTLESMQRDGKLLGIPFNQEGYGFVYNEAVFEEAGVNPQEIQSYEDLENAVETLDTQKEELGIEEVFAYPAKEKWVGGNHLSSPYLAPEFDQNVLQAFNADTVKFEKADEFQRMLDLQVDYSIQPTLNLDYSMQVEQYFSLEEVAIIQQGNWIYPTVEALAPEFAENNMGMMPIPVEGHEGKMPVGVPNYWGVNNSKDEEVVQASIDFLDWMNTSEEGKNAILNEFNFVPAYEGYETSDIQDPLSKAVYEHASNGETIGWVFQGYPIAWGDYVGANIQKYLSDGMSWEELIEDSTAEWESLRSE